MELPSIELISQITDIDERQILDMEIIHNEIILQYNEYAKYQNPNDTYDYPFDLYFLMSECKSKAIESIFELELQSSLTKNGAKCKILNEDGNELYTKEIVRNIELEEKEKEEYYDGYEGMNYSEIEAVFDCYQWIK